MSSEEPNIIETETNEKESGSEWKVDQLVWAKIPGYPYWPAIVCFLYYQINN